MQALMWPLLKVLGISCKRAFQLSAEQVDRKLSRREAIGLRVHLMLCSVCRPLPGQFRQLRELVQCCQDDPGKAHADECLPPEAKDRIASGIRDSKQSAS